MSAQERRVGFEKLSIRERIRLMSKIANPSMTLRELGEYYACSHVMVAQYRKLEILYGSDDGEQILDKIDQGTLVWSNVVKALQKCQTENEIPITMRAILESNPNELIKARGRILDPSKPDRRRINSGRRKRI